jgi:membrane protein DedA with SNARE-associated domain
MPTNNSCNRCGSWRRSDPFAVLERLIHTLVEFVSGLGPWAYLIIFLAACLESAAFLGFLVPGETLVFLGGFLASQGVLDLYRLMIVVSIGAIIGDSVGYELGRRLGRAWLLRVGRRFGIHEERFQKVDRFLARHGGKTVFLARFTAFFRIMVPFFVGAARYRYLSFLLYNVLGGIVWSVASVLAGYLAGESWLIVERWIGRAGTILAAVILVVFAGLWLWRRKARV